MPTVSMIHQAAAVPVWSGRVCLVTSRSGKHWIVPKGHQEAEHTLAQTALKEAWEEAGLIGYLEDQSIGTYQYKKAGDLYHVTVFRMQVTEMARLWPEAHERQRIWVAEDKAHKRVEPAGLREVLRNSLLLCAAT